MHRRRGKSPAHDVTPVNRSETVVWTLAAVQTSTSHSIASWRGRNLLNVSLLRHRHWGLEVNERVLMAREVAVTVGTWGVHMAVSAAWLRL